MLFDTCSIVSLYTFFVISWSSFEMSHEGRNRYDTKIIRRFSTDNVYFTR